MHTSVGHTHRQHKLYQFPWLALSKQFWRETIPAVIVGNTHSHCSRTIIRLRTIDCLIKTLWVTIINRRIKNPDIDSPPTLIYNVGRKTCGLRWLPPLWIYNQDPHPRVVFRHLMVLEIMIHTDFIFINNNNNTFDPGSQSPVSAMSAIRNCKTNSNIPYLHCELVLVVEVAIPMRPALLRLAIVVVPLWSHLRMNPSLRIHN